jgi:hypothetical protein
VLLLPDAAGAVQEVLRVVRLAKKIVEGREKLDDLKDRAGAANAVPGTASTVTAQTTVTAAVSTPRLPAPMRAPPPG